MVRDAIGERIGERIDANYDKLVSELVSENTRLEHFNATHCYQEVV